VTLEVGPGLALDLVGVDVVLDGVGVFVVSEALGLFFFFGVVDVATCVV